MNEPIASLERIRMEAKSAATLHIDVNDACPYPFDSDAGRAFRSQFTLERNRLLMPAPKAEGATT